MMEYKELANLDNVKILGFKADIKSISQTLNKTTAISVSMQVFSFPKNKTYIIVAPQDKLLDLIQPLPPKSRYAQGLCILKVA